MTTSPRRDALIAETEELAITAQSVANRLRAAGLLDAANAALKAAKDLHDMTVSINGGHSTHSLALFFGHAHQSGDEDDSS